MTQHTQDIASNVIATLAGKVIDVRLLEQKAQAELHRGIREMHALGVSVDTLSSDSGLTIAQVRAVLNSDEDRAASDLNALSGVC